MTTRRLWMVVWLACATQLLLSSTLRAQNFERYQPQTFAPLQAGKIVLDSQQDDRATTKSSDVILVDALDAVILLKSPDAVDPHQAWADLDGIHSRITSPGSLANTSKVQQVIDRHLGRPITLRNLNKMTRDIISVYDKCGQPITDVQIPEQKITGGTVQIVIIESRIGAINITGGCWVDPCLLRQGITQSRIGSRIYESCVAEDLYWLNRSPFRSVGLDIKPGMVDGTSDLNFDVNDVFPMRAYVGYEDTGVQALGLERLYSGLLIGNPFGRDGTLGYQYTADSQFSRLNAHALSYNVDPSRKHGFQVFGSWASAKPLLPQPLTQNGEAWQVGTRAFRYSTRTAREERAIFIGADFKSSNTSVEFGALNAQSTAADLLQLSIGYKALVRGDNGDYTRLNTMLNYGPEAGFTSRHNATAFNGLRQNTAPGYTYWRTILDLRRQLGCHYEWNARGVGQIASNRLLFSETIGFGGYDSIRGYDQRVASGDNGWLASFEFGPTAWTNGCGKFERTVKVYGFADLGQSFIVDVVPGEEQEQFLSSVGIGCRLAVGQKMSLRLDYGHGFNDVQGAPSGDRIHVGFVSFFGPTPRVR